MNRTIPISSTPLETRFFRLLPRVAANPQPALVHRLRTTLRRIETLLAMQEAGKSKKGKKVLRQLRRLRRRAGRIRDLDVQLAALRSISLHTEAESKAQLLAYLDLRRDRRVKKLLAALRPKQRARLRAGLRALQARRGAGELAQKQNTRRAAAAWAELWRRWNEHRPASPAEVHAFRVQCKRVRYTHEQAEKTPLQEAAITRLVSIQDAIGAWHDWLTLAQTAGERLPPASPLLAAIRNMTGARLDEALRISEREMAELALAHSARKQPVASVPPAADAAVSQ